MVRSGEGEGRGGEGEREAKGAPEQRNPHNPNEKWTVYTKEERRKIMASDFVRKSSGLCRKLKGLSSSSRLFFVVVGRKKGAH